MTPIIHNSYDLRNAYSWLRLLTCTRDSAGRPEVIDDRIREYKVAIRKYHRQQRVRADRAPVLVRDDGIDGYVIRQPLLRALQSLEEADEYFRENEYIHYQYGPYDCTGQAFTRWYKVYRANDGRYWAYHSVGFDV